MIAVDTSVLAFAVNRFAPEHARCARVLERLAESDRPWALPWSVIGEFLALVTHPHAVARTLQPADALGFVDELLATPGARALSPGSGHAAALREALAFADASSGLPSGFATAALLREHGVRDLLSADAGMRRFSFLDVRDPLRGAEWTWAEPPSRRYRVLSAGPESRRPAGAVPSRERSRP